MFMRLRFLALALALVLPAAALAQEPVAPAEPAIEPATDQPADQTVDPAADAAEPVADVAEPADPAAAGDLTLAMEDVQALQETLKDLGYFHGPADGRKGPRTRTALRNFQRDQGLDVTGSFDQPTVQRIDDQARLARTEHKPAPVPPSSGRGGGGGVGDVRDAVKVGVGAVGTAGKATGRAGATAGRATAKAGEATWDAGTTAAKAVGKSGVFVWNQSRRAVVGEKSGDDDIRRRVLRQYADDDRIVPDELEVRVSDGNVTLELPEGARTDVPHAVRLAKLTSGVRSVTAVTTSVDPVTQ
jgi:peptidoglycan hydrolase-like protein with peptidoglycan-binding domain